MEKPPKKPLGQPTIHVKPGIEVSVTLPIPMIRDLEKIERDEPSMPKRKKLRAHALIFLWEYWKKHEGK